jgi:hypothetical protein
MLLFIDNKNAAQQGHIMHGEPNETTSRLLAAFFAAFFFARLAATLQSFGVLLAPLPLLSAAPPWSMVPVGLLCETRYNINTDENCQAGISISSIPIHHSNWIVEVLFAPSFANAYNHNTASTQHTPISSIARQASAFFSIPIHHSNWIVEVLFAPSFANAYHNTASPQQTPISPPRLSQCQSPSLQKNSSLQSRVAVKL